MRRPCPPPVARLEEGRERFGRRCSYDRYTAADRRTVQGDEVVNAPDLPLHSPLCAAIARGEDYARVPVDRSSPAALRTCARDSCHIAESLRRRRGESHGRPEETHTVKGSQERDSHRRACSPAAPATRSDTSAIPLRARHRAVARPRLVDTDITSHQRTIANACTYTRSATGAFLIAQVQSCLTGFSQCDSLH